MTRRGYVPLLTASVAVTLALSPVRAQADMTKAQCIDADTKGQDLVRAGKLSAAREQLRTCASASCPPLVRDDCTKRLNDVESAQPAIVFDAKDGSGRDLSAVKVTIDGRLLAEKLDGTALQVDPGEHVFVFTGPDQSPLTETFVLKEGDKDRRERIVMGQLAASVPAQPPMPGAASSTAPSSESKSARGIGTQKILGLVAGVAGVAGLGVGSVFGLMALSEVSQQQKDCASPTNCPNASEAASDHSTAMTDRTISTVGFIAGGALLVGGAVLFFTAGLSSESRTAKGMLVVPTAGPGGGGISWIGEF